MGDHRSLVISMLEWEEDGDSRRVVDIYDLMTFGKRYFIGWEEPYDELQHQPLAEETIFVRRQAMADEELQRLAFPERRTKSVTESQIAPSSWKFRTTYTPTENGVYHLVLPPRCIFLRVDMSGLDPLNLLNCYPKKELRIERICLTFDFEHTVNIEVLFQEVDEEVFSDFDPEAERKKRFSKHQESG